MRFEVINRMSSSAAAVEVPWTEPGGEAFLDLRNDAGAISRIGAARENPPLAALIVSVNGDASLFSTTRAKTWSAAAQGNGEDGAAEFGSRVELVLADPKLRENSAMTEDAVRRLVELWMKESGADTLSARLEVLPCRLGAAAAKGAAIRISLSARGETPEQARMRWGLGVARLQQALLFVSRAMRVKLGIERS